MARWLGAPNDRLFGAPVLAAGMRVLSERREDAGERPGRGLFYRTVLGGARRAQHGVAATAPDAFLRAMFLGSGGGRGRRGGGCKVRTLGALGPFADIVHITIPPMEVFWTRPLSMLGIRGAERHFVCVRRWETNEDVRAKRKRARNGLGLPDELLVYCSRAQGKGQQQQRSRAARRPPCSVLASG
jgi:hypothetical protein